MRRPLILAATLLFVASFPLHAAEDPLEGMNRRVHAFNEAVRGNLVAPLARLTLRHMPAGVRRGAAQALATLGEPVATVAALAAGEVDLAKNAAARFAINATLGWAGTRDVATGMGYPRHAFGFADTACRWGIPSGPYLVLPLLGPATLRDDSAQALSATALAQLVGSEALLAWSGAETFLGYAALHPDVERLQAESLDAYAVLRSAYLQRRAAACPVDRTIGDDAER